MGKAKKTKGIKTKAYVVTDDDGKIHLDANDFVINGNKINIPDGVWEKVLEEHSELSVKQVKALESLRNSFVANVISAASDDTVDIMDKDDEINQVLITSDLTSASFKATVNREKMFTNGKTNPIYGSATLSMSIRRSKGKEMVSSLDLMKKKAGERLAKK